MGLLSAGPAVAKLVPPHVVRVVRDAYEGGRVQCLVDRGTEARIDPGDEFLVCRQLSVGDEPIKRVLTGTLTITAAQLGSALGAFAEGLRGVGPPRLKLGPVAKGDLLLPRLVIDSSVLFTPGSATLGAQAAAALARAAAVVGRYAPTKAVVTAYAVEDGGPAAGKALSLEQAECVCRQLDALSRAIKTGMLLAVGGGAPPASRSSVPGGDQAPVAYVEIVIWE